MIRVDTKVSKYCRRRSETVDEVPRRLREWQVDRGYEGEEKWRCETFVLFQG